MSRINTDAETQAQSDTQEDSGATTAITAITAISGMMTQIGAQAKAASTVLAFAESRAKAQALEVAADAVQAQHREIIHANAKDMAYGREKGLGAAMLDRLRLDEARIEGICHALRTIAAQEDPIGTTMAQWTRPNGLHIKRVRTPLGVVGVIFESRPNVCTDAGALCLKSGNAVILRGGSESFHSCAALHACLVAGLRAAHLPETAIQLVPTRDRAAVRALLRMTDSVDVIVPRGGKQLVGLVQSEARVPVFAHLEGIVHIYVDRAADAAKARRVVVNAKTRRTGICGAAECLLIHQDVAESIGKELLQALMAVGVVVHAEPRLLHIAGTKAASAADWGREYLDMQIAARVVENTDAAIDHIRCYGSAHTDCVITEDDHTAARFFERVDSAIVMRNASTQFADGGEFGLGAEIGIATGKLHARGPVGAEQLTSFKYLVQGHGTTRP